MTAINLPYGTMSPDNLTISQSVNTPPGRSPTAWSVGSRDISSGRYYVEFTVNDQNPIGDEAVGVGPGSPDLLSQQLLTSDGSVWGYSSKTMDTGLAFSPGCVVGMAMGNRQV
jgi:hypothetical protein